MNKSDIKFWVISMNSPGGRFYKFGLEKTEQHSADLRSKDKNNIMLAYLQKLKENGLKPQETQETKLQESRSQETRSEESHQKHIAEDNGNILQPDCNVEPLDTMIEVESDVEPWDNSKSDDMEYENNMMQSQRNLDIVSDEGDPDVGKKRKSVPKSSAGASKKARKAPNSKPTNTVETQHKKNAKDQRVKDLFKDKAKIFAIERRILEEVFKRPPIFNFKLDFKDRTPDGIFLLYVEISNLISDEMDLTLSTKVVENTWKDYKELYTQYKNQDTLPSGSGAKRIVPPKHLDVLRQLDFLIEKRPQVSTLSDELIPPNQRPTKGEQNAHFSKRRLSF